MAPHEMTGDTTTTPHFDSLGVNRHDGDGSAVAAHTVFSSHRSGRATAVRLATLIIQRRTNQPSLRINGTPRPP